MIQKMVLYGPLSFDLIDHPPLKQHITAVMRPLGVGGEILKEQFFSA